LALQENKAKFKVPKLAQSVEQRFHKPKKGKKKGRKKIDENPEST
jgi:hypothetical protein